MKLDKNINRVDEVFFKSSKQFREIFFRLLELVNYNVSKKYTIVSDSFEVRSVSLVVVLGAAIIFLTVFLNFLSI